MSLTGRNTLSLRKKDVLEQRHGGSAYKRLVFAHKATAAGQTGINITSLTQPSEMASLGFTNPSTAELQAAKMLFYKKNLTIISSSKGLLMQDLSYTVPTNERIAFQGFTSDENEIFTCILESSVKDGLQVVDAISINSTGDLAISATDYNVGIPFEIGKNISTQIGAVLVFRDGIIQARNPSNGTTGGNYQEVDAGGGLGSIIRFNIAPAGETAGIIVVSNGMVAERPTGSLMAVVESLAGQMDLVIPTLSDLSGQPESNFQGAPNSMDLKNFGDKVAKILTANVPITTSLVSDGLITIGAVTTPPVKGTTSTDKVLWRREGQYLWAYYEYVQTATGSGTTGSGNYLFSLPAGLSMDTSVITVNSVLNTITSNSTNIGVFNGFAAGASQATPAFAVPYSATQFRLTGLFGGAANVVGSANWSLNNATVSFGGWIKVPISGWADTQTLAAQLGL